MSMNKFIGKRKKMPLPLTREQEGVLPSSVVKADSIINKEEQDATNTQKEIIVKLTIVNTDSDKKK